MNTATGHCRTVLTAPCLLYVIRCCQPLRVVRLGFLPGTLDFLLISHFVWSWQGCNIGAIGFEMKALGKHIYRQQHHCEKRGQLLCQCSNCYL